MFVLEYLDDPDAIYRHPVRGLGKEVWRSCLINPHASCSFSLDRNAQMHPRTINPRAISHTVLYWSRV